MSNSDNSANRNLDSSKSPITPSHQALESENSATGEHGEHTKLDQSAMESAKRSQNRIHNDEETTPDSSIFSK